MFVGCSAFSKKCLRETNHTTNKPEDPGEISFLVIVCIIVKLVKTNTWYCIWASRPQSRPLPRE